MYDRKKELAEVNKMRKLLNLPLINMQNRKCAHCNEPILCYKGQIWCANCRGLMRQHAAGMPYEQVELHQ